MANVINPVSSKITIALNSTPAGGAAQTTNVQISKISTNAGAAAIAALAAAVTPLFAYAVVSVKKTDVGLLASE